MSVTTFIELGRGDTYDFTRELGFLPKRDPAPFVEKRGLHDFNEAMMEISDRLASHAWHKRMEKLKLPDIRQLELTPHQMEALFRDLAFAAAAYLYENWDTDQVCDRIPANIAVPLVHLGKHLGRPPLLHYHLYGPGNWRRFEKQGPIAFENLALIRGFYKGLDESGFILPHIEIEALSGTVLSDVIGAQNAALAGDVSQVAFLLRTGAQVLRRVTGVLSSIPDRCSPEVYDIRVRPWIMGYCRNPLLPNGVVYEGTDLDPVETKSFRGETGAQSAIFPCLDAALHVLHDLESPLSVHLRHLCKSRPLKHRLLLEAIETRPNIRDFALLRSQLYGPYNAFIEAMVAFRRQHYEFAMAYIFNRPTRRASLANPPQVGTGGTDFAASLWQHIEDTERAYIE